MCFPSDPAFLFFLSIYLREIVVEAPKEVGSRTLTTSMLARGKQEKKKQPKHRLYSTPRFDVMVRNFNHHLFVP